MKKEVRDNRQKGFTLIEVIASFVIVGIMSAMLVTFMGTSVQRAGDTALFTQTVCSANSKAQEVFLSFGQQYLDEVGGLSDFNSSISSGTYNGGGNTVASAWVRLDGTNITTQGAGASDGYLRVTITPQEGSPLTFLISQTIL